MIFLSSASAPTVGVSKGETFDYSYNIAWTSTNPSATPPSDALEYNNTQKVQLTITNVQGSIISVDVTSSFKNGSQKTVSGTIDIENSGYTVPFGFLIVGANIAKGQPIYPAGGQLVTDTVSRSYPSGQRETNLISAQNSDEKVTTYFDKIKGVAVDYSHTMYETASDGSSITSTEQLVCTNSDVWTSTSYHPSPVPTSTSGSTTAPTQSSTSNPTSNNGASKTPNPTNGGSNPTSTVQTPLNTSAGLIIGGIIIVIVVALVAFLVMLRKRKPRKGKAGEFSDEDFDLSGWNMK
jgi:hypothetical protein